MTKSRLEDYAADNLRRQGFEFYLPKFVSPENPKPQILFPSYIFVLVVDRWRSLRSTFGIVDVCMDGDKPARLQSWEMKKLRAREIGDGILALDPFKVGQRVRSKRGWAKDQLAIFVGMTGGDRCQVLMDMLGMKCRVDASVKDLVAA